MVISAAQLRPGKAIRFEGQVYKVLEADFKAGGGQAGGVEKTRLQNLATGRLWDHDFRPDERLVAFGLKPTAKIQESLSFKFLVDKALSRDAYLYGNLHKYSLFIHLSA